MTVVFCLIHDLLNKEGPHITLVSLYIMCVLEDRVSPTSLVIKSLKDEQNTLKIEKCTSYLNVDQFLCLIKKNE